MRAVFEFPKINWYPGHMHRGTKQIMKKLDICDVLLEIRDARIPLSSQNSLNSSLMKNKLKLLVLNKIDLCSVAYTKGVFT